MTPDGVLEVVVDHHARPQGARATYEREHASAAPGVACLRVLEYIVLSYKIKYINVRCYKVTGSLNEKRKIYGSFQ